MKTKPKIDYGEGECEYRFCDLPRKKFKKKKKNQEYCCDRHRVNEWNLRNPRTKAGIDAKNQVALPFEGSIQTVELPPFQMKTTGREIANIKWPDVFKAAPKRKFHYTKIDGTGKRAVILRDTLKYLLECNPTTYEIGIRTKSTRASSDVSELREQGFVSECVPCKAADETIVNRFQLTPEGRAAAEKFFAEWR